MDFIQSARLLAVSAKMTHVLPGRCVHNEHAPVAVTIGDVHEVSLRIHDHIGWPEGLGCAVDAAVAIVAVRPLCARRADLVDERAVWLEFQDMCSGNDPAVHV